MISLPPNLCSWKLSAFRQVAIGAFGVPVSAQFVQDRSAVHVFSTDMQGRHSADSGRTVGHSETKIKTETALTWC